MYSLQLEDWRYLDKQALSNFTLCNANESVKGIFILQKMVVYLEISSVVCWDFTLLELYKGLS